MIHPSKKVKKRHNNLLPELKVMTPMLRVSQEQRIAHLAGVESEIMRHGAKYRDETLEHHKHQDQSFNTRGDLEL